MNQQFQNPILRSCLAGVVAVSIAHQPLPKLFQKNVLEKLIPPVVAEVVAEATRPVVKEPIKLTVVATGYSSTPDQTDDTPFITASGRLVSEGTVAANFLSFGTKIKLPDGRILTVLDRMNRRYDKVVPHRIDVWFPERAAAKNFGRQTIEIIIVNS